MTAPGWLSPQDARMILRLARQVAWFWAAVGVAVALPVALFARSAWGMAAFVPYAITQGCELVIRRRLREWL